MLATQGPLDPDPFGSAYARPVAGAARPLLVGPYYLPYGWMRNPPQLVPCSAACVAYIPPGHLRGKFALFGDDSVNAQPDWLSAAYVGNRFRFAHGLRVSAIGWDVATEPFESAVFAKANPTTLRFLRLARFPAPIEYSLATRILPPPRSRLGVLLVAGSHARAKNGFLATRMGGWLARLRTADTPVPQIGISLQIWIAEDGCKCVAVAHNYFPQYDVYIDGVRFAWDAQPDFARFDAYDIPVEWQAFLAFRLYETLRPFPLIERYPGACLVGWYRQVEKTGLVKWCDEAPDPFYVQFPHPESVAGIVNWWNNLERYVEQFDSLVNERQQPARHSEDMPWWLRDERLWQLWRPIAHGAAAFGRSHDA